jgi:hypothetical protein
LDDDVIMNCAVFNSLKYADAIRCLDSLPLFVCLPGLLDVMQEQHVTTLTRDPCKEMKRLLLLLAVGHANRIKMDD